MACPMDDMTDLDDEEEAYETGPSLAMPPLYVLRTPYYCPECNESLHVYTLGCAAYHDREDSRPLEDFHFLRMIQSLPDSVLALLKPKCPGYFYDRDATYPHPYLMNHCPCGARLDDDFVAGDVGAAFWPSTPDGYRTIRPFLLPVDEPIPIVTSYMLGGGEYLDLYHAPPW
jgi:hypothetical protein